MDLEYIRNSIIGTNTYFMTPFGNRIITYADYTASGKTLTFIENYLIKIQEYYGNTHTDDSFTGQTMTNLVHKAEQNIKKLLGANDDFYIFCTGTGTTGAVKKLTEILGLYITPRLKNTLIRYLKAAFIDDIIDKFNDDFSKIRPIVFVSPYEHHSNYLMWKESFAEVVEIALNFDGQIDLNDLENNLKKVDKNRLKFCAFSAASNITGVITDVYEVARIAHKYDSLVFFDYAASAPYLKINMNYNKESYFDAIYLSPHKFVGGPGSCGILVIHKGLYNKLLSPTVSGGGTVTYVNSNCYDFIDDVETREKAGTPGIIQILKASLVLELKEKIGYEIIENIEKSYIKKVLERLNTNPNIKILGPKEPSKLLSILSFNIKDDDKLLHHKLVSRLLNDLFGIQSRAGCACAGPYAHKLLEIDEFQSQKIHEVIKEGITSLKPGFVRVNFHYLMTEAEVNFICDAIEFIANYGYLFLLIYNINLNSGSWKHNQFTEQNTIVNDFGILTSLQHNYRNNIGVDKSNLYQEYLNEAFNVIKHLKNHFNKNYKIYAEPKYENLRWFNFINYQDI